MSNSTQNDHETHTACIDRVNIRGASATCCFCDPHEGCTLGMNLYPGKFIPVERLPEASKTIDRALQEDWEKRFDEKFTLPNVNEGGYTAGSDYNPNKPRESLNVFVKPDEIKDFIRKELADARKEVIEKVEKELEGLDCGFCNYEKEVKERLATLREEES